MPKRLFLLLAAVLFVGAVTHAFAQQTQSQTITRAGAVALLVEVDALLKARFVVLKEHMPPMPLYADVAIDQWFAPYVEAAFEAGIITGNDVRMFRPADVLREEEAMALVMRAHARHHPASVSVLLASAVSDAHWFDALFAAAAQANITLPQPVSPGRPIERDAYYAMLQSAGSPDPRTLTVQAPSPVFVSQIPVAAALPSAATHAPAPARAPAVRSGTAPVAHAQTVPAPVIRSQTAVPAPVAHNRFSISMPTLGISDLTVTHPADALTKEGLLAPLKYGVGHLFSYPGKGGKILIYGHSSSYAWDVSSYTKIFRQINQLATGDTITVTYGGKQYQYRVSHKQTVPASDMSVYRQGGGEELILYTCWPPDSIKERYLVHAMPM